MSRRKATAKNNRQTAAAVPPPVAVDDVKPDTRACYCHGERDISQLELYCASCDKWFHKRCLKTLTQFYGLPFMVCYTFTCTDCSTSGDESWIAKSANFGHMLVTALANLTAMAANKKRRAANTFSLKNEIVPYFNNNWEQLTSMPRRVKTTWHQTLKRTMLKETDVFTNDADGDLGAMEDDTDMQFGLVETNLLNIGPNSESVKQLGRRSGTSNQTEGQSPPHMDDNSTIGGISVMKTRGSKRKAVSQPESQASLDVKPSTPGSTASTKKKKHNYDYVSTESGNASLVDHPFNKDGYHYFLVEPDENAPHRSKIADQLIIPAFMYRVVCPHSVRLSSHDRAPQLHLSPSSLTVTGDKGYAGVRCTHSVIQGTYYYELTIVEKPRGSHVRFGFAQPYAHIQAPFGYDNFGYVLRSRKGTVFHAGMGKTYGKRELVEGDTIGCLINLPRGDAILPESHKELPLVKFKRQFYVEKKYDPKVATKSISNNPKSSITFYHNGVCMGVAFENLVSGEYHPAVSLFHGCTVDVNFGPNFRYSPVEEHKPMCERHEESAVERTLADLLYLVENKDKLDALVNVGGTETAKTEVKNEI